MQNVYGLSDQGGYIGDNTENFGVNIQVYTKKHSESYPKNNSYPKEGRRIILVKQNENTKFNGIGTKDNPYVIVSK